MERRPRQAAGEPEPGGQGSEPLASGGGRLGLPSKVFFFFSPFFLAKVAKTNPKNPKTQNHGAGRQPFLFFLVFSSFFCGFLWKNPKKTCVFWILLAPGLKNQKSTGFFLDFHAKPQKNPRVFWISGAGLRNQKKHMFFFGFSSKSKKPLVFFGCSTSQRVESKKTHVFFLDFPKKTKKNSRKQKI